MRWLDRTLGSAAENLALDEALLLEAEAGRSGEVLRFWEWSTLAVVLGSGGKLGEDVEDNTCTRDGVQVLRRSSGGGTVLLGQGCLCFSLVLALERDPRLSEIRSSYDAILGRIIDAFALPGLEIAGISDLILDGRKFSGNAQQRKRHHILHHGTLLYQFDLSMVPRYLRQPVRQPEYRADRAHADFIRNLERPRAWLVETLRLAWRAEQPLDTWPAEEVARLVETKYSLAEWVRRR
ncbi:MAG: lipoate--protein ligase family protein [Gemmataceae bacterium]